VVKVICPLIAKRKKRHYAYTKKNLWCVSCKNFSVLVWTKWNRLRLRTFQTAVFCSNVLQWHKWQHFAKNKRLMRTESLQIQTIFTEQRQQVNLLMRAMSYIMPLLRDVWFFCTFARWFCKTFGDFVLLHIFVTDINWNSVETTTNVVS